MQYRCRIGAVCQTNWTLSKIFSVPAGSHSVKKTFSDNNIPCVEENGEDLGNNIMCSR